jgi:60 kDa SS-A/Ro ribonucleoprotein
MSAHYASHVSTRTTPQSESIPGTAQVANSAGGFSWAVTHWDRLRRFLILGNEGGSYYAGTDEEGERKMTIENAKAVTVCAAEDPKRTVDEIVSISVGGRAPKNAPAVFALAMLSAHPKAKKLALEAMPQVCRIPTDLFAFVTALREFRSFGPAVRKSITSWYSKDPRFLAYQMTKYQQREGWSHRDLLRMARVKLGEPTNSILHWAVKGWPGVGEEPHPQKELLPIWAFERAKKATTSAEIVKLIEDFDLVRECIPTEFLNEASVWEALLRKMPLTAMVRNLAKMTGVGLLVPMSAAVKKVTEELDNDERIHKSRLHPIAILKAKLTYEAGHGVKGHNTWTPVTQIINALDGAFYKAFDNVPSTGKRWLLALDVSGSMQCGTVAGTIGLTPRMASAAMSLVTDRAEKQVVFVAFSEGLTPLSISSRQRLDDVVKAINDLPFSGTDCAQPMLYALERRIPIDVFVIYTDSETWAGGIHPTQALAEYRREMGINAKLIVVGMVSNGFTIADPNDSGMMDVVGFDTSAPALMSDFAM